MRTLIGLTLLGLLFLGAAFWQELSTAEARDRRRHEFGVETVEDELPAGVGWTRLVLGSPSGALSRRPELVEGPADDEAGSLDPSIRVGGRGQADLPPEPLPEPDPRAADVPHVVRSGEVLGRICARHYGTSKPRLVQALAAYNGLPSPDALKADDTIWLPPLEVLEREPGD